jgi:hypothetical protein
MPERPPISYRPERHNLGTVDIRRTLALMQQVRLVGDRREETYMADESSVAPTATPEQRIDRASKAIRRMAEDDALQHLPQHDRWLHHLSEATRAAPFQSLAVAFLLGAFLARR